MVQLFSLVKEKLFTYDPFMTELQHIAKGLRRWIEESDESYEQIAKRAGVSKRTIINFMKSESASWKVLEKLIAARDGKNDGKDAA